MKQNIKILHINDKFDWSGGAETYLIQLVEELEKREIENIVIYGEKNKYLEDKIRSYYIPRITSFSFIPNNALKKLKEILFKEKPDVVYLHKIDNLHVIQFCSRSFATFFYMHGYRYICPGTEKYFIRQEKICKKNFGLQCLFYPYSKMCNNRRPDRVLKSFYKVLKAKEALKNIHIIVASNYVRERFIQEGFNGTRISVIPYFTSLPKKFGNSNNPKKILYLGRIAEVKGVNHLLKALALVESDYEVTITGEGKNLNNLKKLEKSLPIDGKVKFVGWVNRKHRDELLKDCAFVVMPSLWPECFGIVGIEAMAFGKPVVAYNVGGVSDWLKDGVNGFLVPRADYKKLAEKIDFLLNNPDITSELGMKGRDMVRADFSAEKHVEKLLRTFEGRQ